MKKLILTTFLLAAAFTFTSSAQNLCAEFKNRTYIAFNEAKFDDFPNAAGAFRVKFNADGSIGTARFFTAYTPEAANGLQQKYIFTCKKTGNGDGYFDLTVGDTKISAGGFLFKSFERGAKVWLKHTVPNRDTPFWMIELPADPRGDQFPKTK